MARGDDTGYRGGGVLLVALARIVPHVFHARMNNPETEQLVAAIFHAERSAAKKARGNHRRIDAEKLAKSIAERLAGEREEGGRG